MDLSLISQFDWHHLSTRYPDAYAFLLHASLIGEWENLLTIRPDRLNDWQKKRIEELSQLFKKPGDES